METTSNDIEMLCLRRSQRVANKPVKLLINPPTFKKAKSKSSKKAVVALPKQRGVVFQEDKFQDLTRTKISDLFALIKKHTTCPNDRTMKYLILKTIVKNSRKLSINNSLLDLNIHHQRISHILPNYIHNLNVPTLSVIDHINEILNYAELWRLDEYGDTTIGVTDIELMMSSVSVCENHTYDINRVLEDFSRMGM